MRYYRSVSLTVYAVRTVVLDDDCTRTHLLTYLFIYLRPVALFQKTEICRRSAAAAVPVYLPAARSA